MAEETGETVGKGNVPSLAHPWVPAFAGMTEEGVGGGDWSENNRGDRRNRLERDCPPKGPL